MFFFPRPRHANRHGEMRHPRHDSAPEDPRRRSSDDALARAFFPSKFFRIAAAHLRNSRRRSARRLDTRKKLSLLI